MATLTPEQEVRIQDLLERDQFDSPEQFIGYALALVENEDDDTTVWFKGQLVRGIKSLDEGHYSTKSTGEIIAEAERELTKRRRGWRRIARSWKPIRTSVISGLLGRS